MEFRLSENLGVPLDFDNKDFLEFSWMYNRLVEKLKRAEMRAQIGANRG